VGGGVVIARCTVIGCPFLTRWVDHCPAHQPGDQMSKTTICAAPSCRVIIPAANDRCPAHRALRGSLPPWWPRITETADGYELAIVVSEPLRSREAAEEMARFVTGHMNRRLLDVAGQIEAALLPVDQDAA
jgi:hypothetical protein